MGGSVAQIVTVAALEVSEANQERLQSAAMGAVEYTNLRLSFKQCGDREYEVIAAIDDGPATTSTFTIPMSDEALQDAIRDLSATRSALTEPVTRKVTPVTEPKVTARQFGATLADALITGDIETMFDEARSKGAVRVRLNMTSEPELLRIPWEYLRRNGKDLASQRDSTIVRELETSEPARPHLVEGKIRMLGVIANPIGDLDVAGEKRRVEEAIAKCRDQIDLEWLEDCTFKSLQRKLQDPYHILHFVGHSAFTAEGESILLLSDENKQKKEVPADAIAQLIGRQNSLQLVVFNSCDGARTTLDDPFAGIATMLVEQGKSAVIAMQFEITDAAAKAFAEELYYCLIDRRYPIDAAVAEARIAMMDINQIEFATPVLFLRPGNVDLFNFADTPAAALSGAPSAVDVPPNPPSGAPSAVDVPPGPSGGGSKRKRWLVGAGGGVAAVVATVAAVAALSSGGDDPGDEASSPVTFAVDTPASDAAAIEPILSRDAYIANTYCLKSALFRDPYVDATDTEPLDVGLDLCDEALTQLEADGLEDDPIYVEISNRLDDADILSSFVEDATDEPADYQEFADNGEGLYEVIYPMLRTLRGLDVSDFQTLTDDTGVLTVEVPIEWDDIDTTPATFDDGTEAPWIIAAPSITEFQESFETPGMFFTVVEPESSLDETLAEWAPLAGECTDAGIQDYGDAAYTGRYQTFTDCGGTSTVYVTVAAVPPDDAFTAIVVVQLVSDADLAALDQVFATFLVSEQVP